jgi:serine/threonine protein phosphatase 1
MSQLKRFERNEKGNDWVIGDIHGHFTRSQAALDKIGFDPAKDRLFSVGDLVDRGPEGRLALEWLQKPWFHAVQGNHENMAIRHANGGINKEVYHANGGSWFMALTHHDQMEFAQAFSDLPLAIEVDTPTGMVGIVHADCPFPDWEILRDALSRPCDNSLAGRALIASIQWSRERIRNEDTTVVAGIEAVVCGHTPLQYAVRLGNVYFIDTAGWKSGYFTLLNLDSFLANAPALAGWEDQ